VVQPGQRRRVPFLLGRDSQEQKVPNGESLLAELVAHGHQPHGGRRPRAEPVKEQVVVGVVNRRDSTVRLLDWVAEEELRFNQSIVSIELVP